MNKNSNTYIILYSVVMVVVVAVLLSVASMSLKARQDENIVIEKKGDILGTIGRGDGADQAPDKAKYINDQYARYITDSFGVNVAGDRVEGADAFELLRNLAAEYEKPAGERILPVFVSQDEGGRKYVFPLSGSGLWGPIWGYVSLEGDLRTISGVVFDHKSETPGLGAEIASPAFEGQYKGKSIFDGERLTPVAVLKGAGASAGNPAAVDAVSGGTITSRAVEAMMADGLRGYEAFIVKEKTETE